MVKKVYKIDVGDIPASEVDAYMEKIMNKMKNIPYPTLEEMENLGYVQIYQPTKWQKIKRWIKSFFTYGDFTGLGMI